MASKKFYWIKLKTDFFNLDEIDFLLSQKNGCEYIVLYQMLCLKTANNSGRLCTTIGEMMIPFDTDKIVRETKYFDFDTVAVALELFKKLGLVFEEEDGILKISAVEEMVGSETTSAQRVREYRKKKALQCNKDVVYNVAQEIEKEIRERDKSKDIDIDKNISVSVETEKQPKKDKPVKHKYGEYKNVLLTDDELEKLKTEYSDYEELIERLSGYVASTGKAYKSHYATIRNWAKKDQTKPIQPQPAKQQQQSEYERFMSQLQEIYDSEEE